MTPKTNQPQMAGYVGLVAVVAAIIHAILNRRNPAIEEITLWVSTIAAAWGNIQSRQWNRSSEQVGCSIVAAPAAKGAPLFTGPPLQTEHTQVIERPRRPGPPMGGITIVILLCLLASGCVRRDKGDIVGATTTCVGIDISQTQDSGSPHFRIGYIRTQYHLVPTVRGTNSITAPDVSASIHTDVSLGATEISEDFATGQAAQDAAFQEGPTTARQAVATKAAQSRTGNTSTNTNSKTK